MEILPVTTNKKAHLSLLLLADEQESMIDRYLERGDMYMLTEEGEVRALCVVTDEGAGVLELKNLATQPQWQGWGYATALLDYVQTQYRSTHRILQVGTGDSPLTLPFYEKRGFRRTHCVKDFFTKNYDHPIVEAGVLLRDMIYLQRELE